MLFFWNIRYCMGGNIFNPHQALHPDFLQVSACMCNLQNPEVAQLLGPSLWAHLFCLLRFGRDGNKMKSVGIPCNSQVVWSKLEFATSSKHCTCMSKPFYHYPWICLSEALLCEELIFCPTCHSTKIHVVNLRKPTEFLMGVSLILCKQITLNIVRE